MKEQSRITYNLFANRGGAVSRDLICSYCPQKTEQDRNILSFSCPRKDVSYSS